MSAIDGCSVRYSRTYKPKTNKMKGLIQYDGWRNYRRGG